MIEEMLEKYLEDKAQLSFKEKDIEELEKQLEYANQEYIEDEKECIEGMQMSTAVNDTPTSRTNKFSSMTENTALGYKEERIHTNNFDILSIKKKIRKREEEAKPFKTLVDTVDIAMTILDAKEKFIIIRKYFRGYTVPEIVTLFAKNYGYGSKTTIDDMCRKAIEKMDNLLNIKSA